MIGDLIIGFRRLIKQTFCIHIYERHCSPARALTWDQCAFCERTKNWDQNL